MARVARRATLADVGHVIGKTKQNVHYYESGAYKPSVDNLEKIASYLGVSPSWLTYGEGPMFSQKEKGSAA